MNQYDYLIERFKTFVREALLHWPLVVTITVVLTATGLNVYVQAGKPAGDIPGITGDTISVAPATGVNTYDARKFCDDPRTKFRTPVQAPDASGITYEMIRVLDGSLMESVTVVIASNDENSIPYAKHFYEVNQPQSDGSNRIVQESEDAVVNTKARSCIIEHSK